MSGQRRSADPSRTRRHDRMRVNPQLANPRLPAVGPNTEEPGSQRGNDLVEERVVEWILDTGDHNVTAQELSHSRRRVSIVGQLTYEHIVTTERLRDDVAEQLR